MDCGKPPSGVVKVKKKQAKDELDRIKQAEKKKRRLEKALATSAAIISELEKKKQRQKEEQERLDEEGAAIAEAVALQVLSGEDSDDTCGQVIMEKDEESGPWDSCTSNLNLFAGGSRAGAAAIIPPDPYHQQLYGSRNGEFGWILNAHGGSRCEWNEYGCGDDGSFVRGVEAPYVDEISTAGLLAAQAVSSLQIADDGDINAFVYNRMVRG